MKFAKRIHFKINLLNTHTSKDNYAEVTDELFSSTMMIFSQCVNISRCIKMCDINISRCEYINVLYSLNMHYFYMSKISIEVLKMLSVLAI